MQIRLSTVGRVSGRPREATLYAFPVTEGDDRLVIVGSRGGAAAHPAWVHNLRAEPAATLHIGRAERAVRAREVVDADERDRLWRLVCTAFPLYATYQRRTTRVIPLFVLEPDAGEA